MFRFCRYQTVVFAGQYVYRGKVCFSYTKADGLLGRCGRNICYCKYSVTTGCSMKFTSTSFFSWFDRPSGCRPPLWGSSNTLRHTTIPRTPLDEWSLRRRELYLKTHNTHRDRHTLGGIRTRNPKKRTAADQCLDRAVTGIGLLLLHSAL